MRESLVVSFIKFVCQSSRQFCESTGDKGGSTPPALLLLLSRLCLDYETSTISYILTLTDEQFLVQVEQSSKKKNPTISTRQTSKCSLSNAVKLPSLLFLFQHHSPVTPVTTLCAEAREAAQKLLNHYVKVGFHPQRAREPTTEAVRSHAQRVFVRAGAGTDHLPDVEKECGNTGLGQHHRATKCPSRDEEGGGGYYLH